MSQPAPPIPELKKVEAHQVNDEDPWKDDVLGRKPVAEYLTNVVSTISQPFVISLHSPYGTGKTTFIKCWQAHLRGKKYRTVYFNAWDSDFSKDALSAFMVAFKRGIEAPLPSADAATESALFDKIKKRFGKYGDAVKGLAKKQLVPILAKGVISKILGGETASELLKEISADKDVLAEMAGKFAQQAMEDQEAAEKSVEGFKKYLSEIVEEVVSAAGQGDPKTIVVLVDELDRCRPNYAVEVLEAIKHLFSVKGLVFILAVDDKQLRNSVRSVFGQSMKAKEYLRRFVDWNFELPIPPPDRYPNILLSKFRFTKLPCFDSATEYDSPDTFSKLFGELAQQCSLSLRTQDQCYGVANLVLRSLDPNSSALAPVLATLLVIRFSNKNTYDALRNSGAGSYHSLLSDWIAVKKIRGSSNDSWFGDISLLRELIKLWSLLSNRLLDDAGEFFNSVSRSYNSGGYRRPDPATQLKEERARALLLFVQSARYNNLYRNFSGEKTFIGLTIARIEGATLYLSQTK